MAASLCLARSTVARSQPARSHRCVVTASMPPGPQDFNTEVRASRVPTPDEDKEVIHSAFLNAVEQSNHMPHIVGMQEFAGGLLARQRIPSGQYSDPLGHIFEEFDRNRDGSLSAQEVAEALRSRQVQITDELAEMFVESVHGEHRPISKDEFRDMIMHMAAADLHSRRSQHAADPKKGDWQMSSWEEDDQIVAKLQLWTDNMMLRRFK